MARSPISRASVRAAVASYADGYRDYFGRNNARVGGIKTMLDPMPRVVLVPGLGLFGLGRSKKDARIAADLAEAAVATITDAEAVGRFDPLPESDLFDVEYWSLEQAKLGGAKEPPLAGQVAVITGAAGAIGFATAKAFAAAGAEVALLDIDETAAQAKARAIGGAALGVAVRRYRCGIGAGRLCARGIRIRRDRHPGVECRRGLAGPDRRGRRGGAAAEF